MSSWRQVWLVARRELFERGRSRGFLFSLVLTTALIIGSIVAPAYLFPDEGRLRIGLPDDGPDALAQSLVVAAAPYALRVATTDFADRSSAEAALRAEALDAVLVVPRDLATSGELLVRERAEDELLLVVTSAVVALRQGDLLEGAGVPPESLAAVATPPSVRSVDPGGLRDEGALVFANVGVVLMFIGIFSFGFWVLTGVVEEKQSRVVEVLLSSVRPRDVLMGKVLGIGLLGVVQLLVFVAVGLAVVQLTGRLSLPATTLAAVAQLVIWFCLGFGLYATTLGFLGALASRMEEASNASTPVTLLATMSYLVSLLVVSNDPDGIIAVIASLFPFSAPMVVPMRAAFGAISPLEIGLAILITIVTIYGLFAIGGRIYSGAVLQTRGRTRLRDAWRGADRS